ncbi:hypothetical protein AB0G86_23795 [Streptomyces scabiei]|uniref:hypothetical protein n=1 Tax=Streptomyces TaxID=1883 RepID=UPI0029A890AE|nr:hypothetical protein [Streptomyces sp. ND04-05B]MDX3070048.1 hypothetical protein [Streptomyces sp. ND04-05B]
MARRDPERTKYGFTVAAAVDAVPAACRQVIVLAQDLGFLLSDQTLENVELLASEVIANAVLHSDAIRLSMAGLVWSNRVLVRVIARGPVHDSRASW